MIELMIAVVVVGVLAAVALPSYLDSIRKSRRSDAISALSDIQHAQERLRANQPSYAATLTDLGQPATSPKGYYQLELSEVTASGYLIAATPLAGKAQAGDSDCASMSIRASGGDLRYLATTSGGAPNPSCWPQ